MTDTEPEPESGTGTGTGAETTATEIAFRDGRAALRDGDFGVAAALFEQAIAADPDAPLAEDARYWRGVALARAGRSGKARAALTEFLTLHPTSLRAGRAAIVLGNLLAEAGDLDGARARYEQAGSDADPEVRAAAKKALAALAP